ncbi:unnamed protein product [Linum tenue]|uniref:NADH dehydrogenase subunit 4 n=1 Tax=Linum tenue TaxID=586396 RepID=A0AAV0Q1I0_9ROSI|nr:unnamed protein product [Linum tenue]
MIWCTWLWALQPPLLAALFLGTW